jgi:hypothetical protein
MPEDSQVGQPAIALLADVGWRTVNVHDELEREASTLGRESGPMMITTSHQFKGCQYRIYELNSTGEPFKRSNRAGQ